MRGGNRPRSCDRRAGARGRSVVLRLISPVAGLHREEARRRDRGQRLLGLTALWGPPPPATRSAPDVGDGCWWTAASPASRQRAARSGFRVLVVARAVAVV